MGINFDEVIDRKHTSSIKWSYLEERFGAEDLSSMWVADSDFRVHKDVIDALRTRVDHGIFGYTEKPESFYTSFIKWVNKRHGWDIQKAWMIFTPGIVPAITWAVNSFTKPGDKIIIQPPVYPPFYSSVADNDRIVVENTLIEKDGVYTMDFQGLIDMIDEHTKMIILCNPHNPIGRVWTKSELLQLGEICLENDIKIISDEIHSDLVYKGHKHIPIASLSDALSDITMTCMAPSKTFNIAGLESSVTVIKNKKMRNEFVNFQNSIGMGMTNIFAAVGFTACYETGEEWLEEQLVYTKENYNFFKAYIEKYLPAFTVSPLEGTYLIWLKCDALNMTPDEMKDFFVKEVKVALNQGAMFGVSGQNFMRFNISTPRVHIVKVLEQLKTAYESLGL